MKAKVDIGLAVCFLFGALNAEGKIETSPAPIEDRFAQSDVVCRGRAIAVREVSGRSPEVNGRLVPPDYEIQFQTDSCYKGSSSAQILSVFLPEVDPMGGPPTSEDTNSLLFLLWDGSRYRIASTSGANLPFWRIASSSTALDTGSLGLERDVMADRKSNPASTKSPGTLPGLERIVVSSPLPSLRRSAMIGMRNRRDPKTVPFLIQQLNSDDAVVMYKAISTLDEITRIPREMGPGMDMFEKDPNKYRSLWLNWWHSEQSSKYR